MEGYVTMKKILAVLTVIVMLGCMLSVTAFADGGYDLGIGSVVMAIAVSGGVAYVCTKKARTRA